MTQRVIITAGWLAAAVLAVLVGLVAIRLIGDGITSQGIEPMSQAEVERQLAAVPSAPPVPSSAPSSVPSSAPQPSPSTAGNSGSWLNDGGTVVARCIDGRIEIVSMSPALGFETHEWETGPQDDEAEGEFRSLTDNDARIKVDVRCDASGEPQISVRSERDDDD